MKKYILAVLAMFIMTTPFVMATSLEPNTQQNIASDTCNKLSAYTNEPWFSQAETKYQTEFLYPQGLSGGLGSEFGVGCFIEDLALFVFIPEYYEFGCGKIFSYDIERGILKTPQPDYNAPPLYCASEFGQITDDYIEFKGLQGDAGQGTQYQGKYYFLENTIELTQRSR